MPACRKENGWPPKRRCISTDHSGREDRTGARARGLLWKKSRIIYSSLRETGIDLVAYVPDSANYLIQRFAREDDSIISVAATREDDALAIAMGAFMGGW